MSSVTCPNWLDWSRTTRTHAFWEYTHRPMITNSIDWYWTRSQNMTKYSHKFKNFKFLNKLCTRHSFWRWLIRCVNMKWIRQVLLKIQSGHDFVHRQTDGQTDKVKTVNSHSTSLSGAVYDYRQCKNYVCCVRKYHHVKMMYRNSSSSQCY